MRVLIVDHHILFREGLVLLLGQEEGFQSVDQAGSLNEALEKTVALQPDVLIFDADLPDANGIEYIPTFLQLSPKTNIVLLTTFEDESLYSQALQCGAKACLTKNVSYAQLVGILKTQGSSQESLTETQPLQPSGEFLETTHLGNGGNHSDLRFLTQREREVLEQLGTEANNQEIADSLGITTNTVKVYISRIIGKLHLNSRVEAVRFASTGKNDEPNK